MAHIETSIHINRPIEDVFAYVTDPAHLKDWTPDLVDSYADGPTQLGTKLTQVRNFLGQRIEATAEVTEFDPPNRMGLKSIGGSVTFVGVFTFEAMGGGTHLTQTFDIAPAGVLKIAEGAFASQAEKSNQQALATLKSILET